MFPFKWETLWLASVWFPCLTKRNLPPKLSVLGSLQGHIKNGFWPEPRSLVSHLECLGKHKEANWFIEGVIPIHSLLIEPAREPYGWLPLASLPKGSCAQSYLFPIPKKIGDSDWLPFGFPARNLETIIGFLLVSLKKQVETMIGFPKPHSPGNSQLRGSGPWIVPKPGAAAAEAAARVALLEERQAMCDEYRVKRPG